MSDLMQMTFQPMQSMDLGVAAARMLLALVTGAVMG